MVRPTLSRLFTYMEQYAHKLQMETKLHLVDQFSFTKIYKNPLTSPVPSLSYPPLQ